MPASIIKPQRAKGTDGVPIAYTATANIKKSAFADANTADEQGPE